MPSHYNEEEAIPIPKEAAFRNISSIVRTPTVPAVKRPTGFRGEEISTIAGMSQPQRRIAAGHRREFGETPDLNLLRRDTSGLGKSEMMPMPIDPTTKRVLEAASTVDITPGGAGGPRGAIPAGPVDLTPRLGEIEAGVEGALPAAFDTGKAHELGLERYQEGQVYLPPGQRGRYADIMDKVLGPAPTGPEGVTRPLTQGIPSEITPPTSSGNAMVDLFRFVSHNKRVQERNRLISEQKQRDIGIEQFEKGQEFKERKLTSEEEGREGALDLSRRKAIATTAKEADKLDPFKKRALDLLQKDPEYPFLQGEEKRTAELRAIEEVERRHGRTKTGEKPKPKEGTTRTIGKKNFKVVKGQWMEV